MRTLKRTAMVLAASAALVGAWVTPGIASVDPQVEQGAVAAFEGRTIDMSEGWQGAHTCAVFAAEDVRCYSSAEAADKATGYDRAADPLMAQATASELAAIPAAQAAGCACTRTRTAAGDGSSSRTPRGRTSTTTDSTTRPPPGGTTRAAVTRDTSPAEVTAQAGT